MGRGGVRGSSGFLVPPRGTSHGRSRKKRSLSSESRTEK